jgi:hypothetical protein
MNHGLAEPGGPLERIRLDLAAQHSGMCPTCEVMRNFLSSPGSYAPHLQAPLFWKSPGRSRECLVRQPDDEADAAQRPARPTALGCLPADQQRAHHPAGRRHGDRGREKVNTGVAGVMIGCGFFPAGVQADLATSASGWPLLPVHAIPRSCTAIIGGRARPAWQRRGRSRGDPDGAG